MDDGKEKRCCDAIMIGHNGPRTPDRLWSTYRNTPLSRKSSFQYDHETKYISKILSTLSENKKVVNCTFVSFITIIIIIFIVISILVSKRHKLNR